MLAFAASAASAPSASAATPCWKRLVNDWYDGRIDRTYPISCYREAIRNLPRDVDEYSSAREDIQRALQQQILNQNQPPPDEDDDDGDGQSGGAVTTTKDPPDSGPGPTGESKSEPTPEQTGVLGEAIKSFRPEDAESVPLPLIVLAGLAGLLLAGAGASYLARRYQSRREGLPDGPPAE